MNSTDTDDLSFVVLGHDSMSNELESRNSMSSYQHSVTGVSTVPQKLDQLIQENYELRATLNKTNMTMKSQFETLTKWQQEVIHAHQSHKEKFFETRELVLQLRIENAGLKQELSDKSAVVRDLIRKVAEIENSNAKLWADNMESTREKKELQDEKAIYLKKITDLEALYALKSKETVQVLRGDYESLAYSSRPSGAATDASISADWSYLESLAISKEPRLEGSTETSPKIAEQSGKEKQWTEEMKKQSDGLKQQLEDLKKELEEKNMLFSSTMKELRKERDDAAVLKAQIEVYKSDYEDERSAREKLVGEKENLAEEVRILKDQLARMEATGQNHQNDPTPLVYERNTPEEGASVMPSPPTQTDDENDGIFICPVCSSPFSDASLCQRHVNFCLDNQINSSSG